MMNRGYRGMGTRPFLLMVAAVALVAVLAVSAVIAPAEESEAVDGDSYVASIGDTRYTSLEDAFNNAQDGETVVLLQSVSDVGRMYLSDGRSVTVDLNGNDITFGGNNSFFWVNYGSLTITGSGTVSDEFRYTPIYITSRDGNDSTETYPVEVTIDSDVTVDGLYSVLVFRHYGVTVNFYGTANAGSTGCGLYMNGKACGNEGYTINQFNVIGATVTNDAGGVAIYAAGYADWYIEDSTITGDSGMEIRAGTLVVVNSHIIGTGAPASVNPNGSGTTTDGAGIAVSQHTTKLAISVTVYSGVIEGFVGFYESNPQGNSDSDLAKITVTILGGTFTTRSGGTLGMYLDDYGTIDATVTGGTFYSDPADYVDEPYAVTQSSAGYTVALIAPTLGIADTTVTIAAPAGTTILYTTDGSDPTTSSTSAEYGGTFTIESGTTVKAVTKYGDSYSSVVSVASTSAGTVQTVTEEATEAVNGTEVTVTTTTTSVDGVVSGVESYAGSVTSSSALTSGTVVVNVTIGDTEDIDASVVIAERMAEDASSRFDVTEVVVNVTIDTGASNTAEITSESTETLAALVATLTVVSDSGAEVTFDQDAVSEMNTKGTGVTVAVRISEDSDLTSRQASAIGSDTAYTLQVISDGDAYSDLGGYATVRIAVSDSSLRVYHVGTDGSKTLISSTYSDGYVTFTTSHFSVYVLSSSSGTVIIPDDNRVVVTPTTTDTSSSDDSAKVVACAAAAVAAALMAAFIFALYRRK